MPPDPPTTPPYSIQIEVPKISAYISASVYSNYAFGTLLWLYIRQSLVLHGWCQCTRGQCRHVVALHLNPYILLVKGRSFLAKSKGRLSLSSVLVTQLRRPGKLV